MAEHPTAPPTPSPLPWRARLRGLMPGLTIVALIALASQFVSEHYGAPAMFLALLFGVSLNFLSSDARCKPGITFGASTLLRFGVALLGLRISGEMVTGLGWGVTALIVGAVAGTIAFGMLMARFFHFRHRFAILSAGAVAICGASAAMAIAAVLPKDERSDERLVFTVVGVTVLSTLAMLFYPLLVPWLGFDDRAAGIFIGGTIHDVAQVVGAGYSISDEAGVTATLVKLLRVLMLAPIVVLIGLVIRWTVTAGPDDGPRPPLFPVFVIAFVALAVVNSLGVLPGWFTDAAASVSRWALLAAIGAVGLRTLPQQILDVGPAAVGLLTVQTLFIATVVAGGLLLFF